MDGYEYAVKVLYPMWNKELEQQRQMIKSHNASSSTNKDMRDRLRDELGIEIKPQNNVEIQMNLSSRILKNPDNFYPELSPDYELIKSTRKSKWG